MKALHFAALVPERAAPAVQAQAYEALRPFVSYVGAAIDAARARQVRHRVSWRVVPEPEHIRLRALDSLLELESVPLLYRVEEWPEEAPPDATRPLVVVNRARLVTVLSVVASPEGPLVTLEEPVLPEDRVFWDDTPCRLVATRASTLPERLFDAERRPLTLRRQFTRGERRWLVLEGRVDALFDARGQPVAAHPREAFTELTRLEDAAGLPVPWSGDAELELARLPAEGPLLGDQGVRFAWAPVRGRERKRPGTWIQLLASEDVERDASVDPRAAFCEEGVSEVRVEGVRDARASFRVRGFQRDSYQLLLERLPPEGSVLQLPVDLKNLRRQMDALQSLRQAPLPHHRGLVRLLEDPRLSRWDTVTPAPVSNWFVLQKEHASGTLQQREFVAKALATPDFAFLEGPPGSGKTHAICELILQFVARGRRVLLCSTTHVAVDNVLERLVGHFPQVEALRIGKAERVDPRVRGRQIDARIAELVARWRDQPGFEGLGDEALERMAQGVVLDSANLTCGTTLGILAHPALRDEAQSRSKPPRFDVLILDETSKTTFQEMLVPALSAERWIVVGDVRQLPPFTDREDLEAALRDVAPGERRADRFMPAHQRACLLLHRLTRPSLQGKAVRWLLPEESEVLEFLARELASRAGDPALSGLEVVRIVSRVPAPPSVLYTEVSVEQLRRGAPEALRVLGARWVLVEPALLGQVERWLPPDPCWTREELRSRQVLAPYRGAHWRRARNALPLPVRERGQELSTLEAVEANEAAFLKEKDWAVEVGWRLVRVHELSPARSRKPQRELEALLPRAAPEAGWVPDAVAAVLDIGLRSALEVLQRGSGTGRVRRPSTLAAGLPLPVWASRAVRLDHQHRMHPSLSSFPRKSFYAEQALKDANTLEGREERVGWSYGKALAARRMWCHVEGRETRGVNREEVRMLRQQLEAFLAWARKNPRREGRWEVACLAFYVRQELALRDMLREVTGQSRETRFELPGVELTSGTVDRFQGREADVVLLSLRNTHREGFLDSPNRLNVALTRARHLLVVVGTRGFFLKSDVEELKTLAQDTPLLVSERQDGRPS
ncbi:AAA domain-containing protein [Archangium primigenium]|uniref:AAA domain-containing protein n=1 Tax=[Archangium] primigenium TaxID=2792470 RepID=UPI00195A1EDE|nr:AAA domain-containing protein [Archangium primigenium]MBM7114914.1 AAA family ATPase [Archangium primigenium]